MQACLCTVELHSVTWLQWWISFLPSIPLQYVSPEGKSNLSLLHLPKPETPASGSCLRLRLRPEKKRLAAEVCLCEWAAVRGSTRLCFKRLDTFQEFNTSLKIHNRGESTLATKCSLINWAESRADGRHISTIRWILVGAVVSNWFPARGEIVLFACMRCVCACTSCSAPSVSRRHHSGIWRHSAVQAALPSRAIGFLQRYLIGLMWT